MSMFVHFIYKHLYSYNIKRQLRKYLLGKMAPTVSAKLFSARSTCAHPHKGSIGLET